MSKDIYILNSCNIWKEYSSMRFVAATTSIRKIKSIIIQMIKEGDMEYTGASDGASRAKQIAKLREDWNNEGKGFVFDNLNYGYVDVVGDGEIQ